MSRIMIVDDATFMRIELKRILESAGHQVVAEASNGNTAFIEYDKYLPDLVTMDVTMPGVTGVEAVKLIRSKHPEARIIMVSAIAQKITIINALASGAKNYILKPFSPEKVITVINQVMGTNNVLPPSNLSVKFESTISNVNKSIGSLQKSIDKVVKG